VTVLPAILELTTTAWLRMTSGASEPVEGGLERDAGFSSAEGSRQDSGDDSPMRLPLAVSAPFGKWTRAGGCSPWGDNTDDLIPPRNPAEWVTGAIGEVPRWVPFGAASEHSI
jgi:hypothetical protein